MQNPHTWFRRDFEGEGIVLQMGDAIGYREMKIMIKKLMTSAAAATLVAAPIAAQAAPVRAPSPTTDEERLAGSLLLPALIALAVAIGIYLIVDDGDDDDLPVSP